MAEKIYRSSDGGDHLTREAADQRDAILKAFEHLKEAQITVLKALAESAITADGVALTDVRGFDLWAIGWDRDRVGGGCLAPCLQKVGLPTHYGNRAILEVDGDVVYIVYELRDQPRRETTVHRVKISEVYAREDAARKKLGQELAKWIAWQVKDLGRTLTGAEAELARGVVRAVADTRYDNPVPVAVAALEAGEDGIPVLLGVLRALGAGPVADAFEASR